MVYLAWIIAILGMCFELAGLLGAGMGWTWGGILMVLAGGILWGLAGSASSRGSG
ncbi:hypothetical protein [Marinobacterium arenosum]|uniref:hypothetical protein n=1 Tax=Marinobacterium arenosum TaxID=2862496 RepID=UPI001C97F72D|nr:hypothetical protein [Marinobacterium arenosum]MBY4676973.1 hypothetical protein [Marinobacterium arenosum]